jgi:adenine specific DNA methylase Mod
VRGPDFSKSRLFYGDNLDVLRTHIKYESVDLICLDPPVNSTRSYNVLFKHKSGRDAQAQIEAFDDTWTWSQESEAAYFDLLRSSSRRVADAIERCGSFSARTTCWRTSR